MDRQTWRKTTYFNAQGRAIRRMVILYTNLEDLIVENDRRYEESLADGSVERNTLELVFFFPSVTG